MSVFTTADPAVLEWRVEDPPSSASADRRRRDVAEVIEAHLPLVDHVVFQVAVHFPRHVDREELARAGALGLIEAAQRYDGSRGVPFERFAAQRIRGAILDAVRAADWAPRSLRRASRTLEAARQRLIAFHGRQPTADELAEELDMAPEKLAELEKRIHRSMVLALDAHAGGEGDGEEGEAALADVLADQQVREPSEELERRELHAYLRDAVQLLPDRHRTVIVGYFFESRTSQDLALTLGVTESRISQLRSEAFEMMREGLEAQYPAVIDLREPDDSQPKGRAARRRAAYADAVASHSSWQDRLEQVELVEQSPELVDLTA